MFDGGRCNGGYTSTPSVFVIPIKIDKQLEYVEFDGYMKRVEVVHIQEDIPFRIRQKAILTPIKR